MKTMNVWAVIGCVGGISVPCPARPLDVHQHQHLGCTFAEHAEVVDAAWLARNITGGGLDARGLAECSYHIRNAVTHGMADFDVALNAIVDVSSRLGTADETSSDRALILATTNSLTGYSSCGQAQIQRLLNPELANVANAEADRRGTLLSEQPEARRLLVEIIRKQETLESPREVHAAFAALYTWVPQSEEAVEAWTIVLSNGNPGMSWLSEVTRDQVPSLIIDQVTETVEVSIRRGEWPSFSELSLMVVANHEVPQQTFADLKNLGVTMHPQADAYELQLVDLGSATTIEELEDLALNRMHVGEIQLRRILLQKMVRLGASDGSVHALLERVEAKLRDHVVGVYAGVDCDAASARIDMHVSRVISPLRAAVGLPARVQHDQARR